MRGYPQLLLRSQPHKFLALVARRRIFAFDVDQSIESAPDVDLLLVLAFVDQHIVN